MQPQAILIERLQTMVFPLSSQQLETRRNVAERVVKELASAVCCQGHHHHAFMLVLVVTHIITNTADTISIVPESSPPPFDLQTCCHRRLPNRKKKTAKQPLPPGNAKSSLLPELLSGMPVLPPTKLLTGTPTRTTRHRNY